MTRLVSATWVLTGRAAIPDGAVALDGDAIVAVGRRGELESRFGQAERLEAVVLPALVNAHLHLEVSHLEGRVEGGAGLPRWIGGFVAARAAAPAEAEAAAMARAVEALRAAGVAAVGDVSNTLASVAPLAGAGLAGTVYHEVFGFTPERIAIALEAARAARARIAAPPGLRIAPSPHAVYSTHPATIAALLEAGPASIHLAEDPAERAFVATGDGPFAAFLDKMGQTGQGAAERRPRARSAVALVAPSLRPHHLAVHCVDLDAEDRAALAASGATVVLCPRSNQRIGGRLPNLPALLAAGIPLAIGTDSLASAASLAPLAELVLLRSEFPDVPGARLMQLAWNGAAVGAPEVGALRPGTAPGIVAAPLATGAWDPWEFLLDAHGAVERPFDWIARHRAEAAR
jgi:aminodeoxyfutalosine deaminase